MKNSLFSAGCFKIPHDTPAPFYSICWIGGKIVSNFQRSRMPCEQNENSWDYTGEMEQHNDDVQAEPEKGFNY